MPDTLPWEDFAIAPTEHGPWEDFAQGGIINNNATPKLDSAARFINKAAAYSPLALQESTNEPPTIATALGIPAGPAQGFAAFPQEILKQGNVQNLAMLPFLSGEAIAAAPNLLKALIEAYFAKGAAEQGGAAAGKLSVTGVPKLPLAPGDLEQQVVAPMLGQKAPEMGGTTEQWRGLGELANALLMGAGAKGVMGGPKALPSGIGPGDVTDVGYSKVPEERQLQAPAAGVPQDRQLPRFAETGQTGMTQPSSGEITQLPQLLSKPQFVTDPRGQVVDVSQLTPWEEAELMRGPREYNTQQEPIKGQPKQLMEPTAEVPSALLPRFTETSQTGMSQRPSGVPIALPQTLTQPKYGVDRSGQVTDFSQLSGQELAELLRGPREYSSPQQGPVAPPFEGQKQLPPPSGGTMQTGPTTIKQTLSNVEQQLKGEQPQLPGQRFYSGVGVNPEDLRPAVEVAGRLLVGQKGDTHTDVLERNGFDPREITHSDPRRMFATADGKQKFDRQAAARIIGKGTAEAGGADSMDLPGAAAAKLMSKLEAQDKTVARTRAGRGETQYYSGVLVLELEKVWDTMKKWYAGPVADTKDWSPLRDPEVMKKEILESKTAVPLRSQAANLKLPSDGPQTTLEDRLIGVQNDAAKKWATAKDLVSKGDKLITPFDVFLDMADGGKAQFNSPLIRNIRWTTDYDFNVELNQQHVLLDPIDKALKDNKLTRKNGLRTGIYSMVQQGLRSRMIENGVPAAYIDSVVKTFSPAEKKVYELTQRQYDETFPAMQSLAKDLLGIDLKHVSNYSPIHSDWRDVQKAPELVKPGGGKEAVEDDLLSFFQGNFRQGSTKTSQGFLQERLPNAKTMMSLDYYDVYKRHMKDVAHFMSSQRRLSELAKIVQDSKFEEKYGDVTQTGIMNWLNNYAKQGRSINSLPQLNVVRKALARGVLGFRVSSQLVHLANVPLGMQRAGLGNYQRGLQFALSEAGQEFLHKNLAETFERGGGEIELLEKQGAITKAAFSPQRFLDRWNSQATALGVYLKENGTFEGPVNQKALANARVITRRAVASPLYKDLPPLLHNQAGKILGQFQNTFMDQWSNIRYDFPEYVRNDPKEAMGLFLALTAMVLVESGVKYEEKKLRHNLENYHPKTDAQDTYEKKVAEEALKRLPGYNQAAANLEYGSTGVPLVDVVKEGAKTAKDLYVANRDEDKTGKLLGGMKAATMAGELAGVPGAGYLGQIAQETVKGKIFKPHAQRIQEIADKAGLDLSDFKQRLAGEAVMKENREPMTEAEKLRSAQAAMKNMSERRQTVMNGLNKEDKQWLKSNKIEPPGFGDYVEEGKVRVPYTDAENRFATETYKSEYETVISYLRNDPGFKQMDRNEQQVKANEEFRAAARRARETVVEVVKSGMLVDKPKRKGVKGLDE